MALPSTSPRMDPRLEDCFLAVFRGDADNDGFNRLVVSAGADWREAAAMQGLCRLPAPARLAFRPALPRRNAQSPCRCSARSPGAVPSALRPRARLDAADRQAAEAPIRQRIEGALTNVPSLDEDRILRQFLNLVSATVRTSYYQEDAAGSAERPSPSSSTARPLKLRRSLAPSGRSGSTHHAWKAFISALRPSPAAASAGLIERRISARRC